jgi:hypothetical protein
MEPRPERHPRSRNSHASQVIPPTSIVLPAQTQSIGISSEPHAGVTAYAQFEPGCTLRCLESYVFGSWTILKSICIPASVEIIESYLFVSQDCADDPSDSNFFPPLETVTFEPHSKLRRIDDDAFFRCNSLESIILPASVTEIGGRSFENCGLRSIEIESGSPYYHTRDSFIADVTDRFIVRYFGRRSDVAVWDHVDVIGPACFEDSSVSRVTFGPFSRLSVIHEGGFGNCQVLESIAIPSTVTYLGTDCFRVCKSLRTVFFGPESQLATVGETAFEGCVSLESLVLPSSIQTIGPKAFEGCKGLVTVAFEAGSQLAAFPKQLFRGCLSLHSLTVPAAVEVIGKECFAECERLALVLFDSNAQLVRIETRAFFKCRALQSFFVPARVESIGLACFMECYSLPRLGFASPSSLRELMDLPPRLWPQAIPDSVEVVRIAADIDRHIDHLLEFGCESKLAIFQHRPLACRFHLRCFLRSPGQCVKRFREALEFEDNRPCWPFHSG